MKERASMAIIKIIHFLPNVNYTSGIANMVMNYYRELNKNKMQFDFLYFGKLQKANFQDEVESLGGNVIKIAKPYRIFTFIRDLVKYMKQQESSKVIFHNHQIAFSVFLYPIMKFLGIKIFIVHNHMTQYSDKLLSAIRNRLLCQPIQYLKVEKWACSAEAAMFMYKTIDNNVIIMENGIDYKKYKFNKYIRDNIRKSLRIENAFVVGHVGRFERVKNHRFIIEVFERVVASKKNAILLLVGTGSLKKQIEDLIYKKGLDKKVIILENRDDVFHILSAMDVFIFPSLFEGLGIAAVEAQASGLPTIVSDKVPEDVKLVNCRVIPLNRNADLWATVVLESYVDDCERFEANSVIEKSRFNIHNNITNIEQVYLSLFNKMR